MQISLTPSRYGLLGNLAGKVLFQFRRILGRHRYDRVAIEWVRGMPFVIVPTVFNPRALRTGEFFASVVDTRVELDGTEVLDMGTGSGVCAVVAARRAQHVVAVDINRSAVRCARMNALMNDVAERVDVRHGDLFEPVGERRFDVVLFNPPFITGEPRDERDRAWRSPDAVRRFASRLLQHLKPGGYALVLLSTFGDAAAYVEQLRGPGLTCAMFAEREYINERVAILKVTRREEGTA